MEQRTDRSRKRGCVYRLTPSCPIRRSRTLRPLCCPVERHHARSTCRAACSNLDGGINGAPTPRGLRRCHPLFQFDLHTTRAIFPRLLSFCYSSSRSVGRENRAQSAHRVGDFRYSRAAKAQDEPLARGRPEIGRREWPQPQILTCGSCGYNAVTVSFWQCHSQVQARLGAVHLQDGIEFFPDAVHKDLSALAVHQPHSPDVSREVPFVDEIREHRLI